MRTVTKTGGYYGAEFKGARGVTQGDPLPSTIFNVVVRHWVSVMVESTEEWGGCGQDDIHQSALFYMEYGMIILSDPRCLQGDFSTLVGLFNRVDLNNNTRKTVGTVCNPCQAEGTQFEAAYGRRMMGAGTSYRERQRGQVQCKECGEEMELGSLAGHM